MDQKQIKPLKSALKWMPQGEIPRSTQKKIAIRIRGRLDEVGIEN